MATSSEFSLERTIALLSRTPAALNSFLRGLPEFWIHRSEGADSWSPFDIVGHLIAGEQTDWMTRARIILQHGERQAFAAFDRLAQKEQSRGKTLERLLDQFAELRRENLAELQRMNLQASDLDRRGKHPALGSVTLAQLLATWAVHDLTHLHQLSRVMACQYRDAAGPWIAYLGVLHCNGHSS
jgi:DinB superfamily